MMMRLLTSFFVLVAATVTGYTQVKQGTEMLFLSGKAGLQDIAVNSNVATTIMFPDRVTLVTGYGLVGSLSETVNFSEREGGVALLHFQQVSDDTLVVRKIRDGEPCFLTVKAGGRTYLLRCIPALEANLAVFISDKDGAPRAIPLEKKQLGTGRLQYDPMILIGILSRAKQRDFLEPVNPDLYKNWEERHGLELKSVSGTAEVTITTVHRWPERDALIFHCIVENLSDATYRFDPRAVAIRVGDRVYPAQLADANGSVGPFEKVAMDVVLMGNTAGGKEHLSVENDFRIELSPPTDQSMTEAEKQRYYTPGDSPFANGK